MFLSAPTRVVCPFAADICSGVRTGGSLYQVKVAAFFAAGRGTFVA